MIIAGKEYGAGSSRDWAAKGTMMLGVKVVLAESYERIHRSNLVGMGVVPCQLPDSVNAVSLRLTGDEVFDILGLTDHSTPKQTLTLIIHRKNKTEERIPLILRLDTPAEIGYVRHGGILPYVLAELAA